MVETDKSFYQNIFANSPVGMTIYDSSGQCIAANNSACLIIGGSNEQLLAQVQANQVLERIWAGTKCKRCSELNRATHKKVMLTTTFGKELTLDVHFLPTTSNKETYLLCTFDDLFKQKQAEYEREYIHKKCHVSLDLMHYMISHARGAIAVHDRI